MQHSLHYTAIVAAALGLTACAAPEDAVAPRAAISSDRTAAPSVHTVQVTGGGTTTFGADLDGDGDVDGSHFGFAAVTERRKDTSRASWPATRTSSDCT